MEEFLHVFLHALKDTAVLLPVLFIVYLLIELLEYKNAFKFENYGTFVFFGDAHKFNPFLR